MGCFNKNQSVPAVFYNATIQKVHFHIPSDHSIYGESLLFCIRIPSGLPSYCDLSPSEKMSLHVSLRDLLYKNPIIAL